MALGLRRGQVIQKMENMTVIGMHATYGCAVFLLICAAAIKMRFRSRNPSLPPALPLGKVSYWFYRRLDIIVVACIVGFYYLLVVLNSVVAEGPKNREITATDLILNAGLQFFMVAVVIAMVIGRISPITWLGLKWKSWPWVFWIAPVTVLTMWTAFAGLYASGYNDLMEDLGLQMVQESVDLLQTTQEIKILILMSLTAVILAPLCEEIVFRGYIYPTLKKFSGPWIAAIVSALFFSAAHGSLVTLAPLFIFGLALVFLYEWTGSIWAPISAHLLFNGATVVIQLLIRFGYIPDQMQ